MDKIGLPVPNEHNNKTSSRARLVFPLVLIFFFIAMMVVYTTRLLYRASVTNVRDAGEDRIVGVSEQIDNYLDTAKGVLWATCDAVDSMLDNSITNDQIRRYLVNESERTASQFDESYTGIYGYINNEYIDGVGWVPPDDYDPTERDWYKVAVAAAGKSAIVPPYVDAQTGKVIISISRMLPKNGYVISLDLTLDSIQALMKNFKLNDKGYGFIVDSSGLIIAHRDEKLKGDNLQNIKNNNDLLKTIVQTREGCFEHIIDNEKCTVFVDEVMGEWYSVLVLSDRELYEDVWRQTIATILISTVIYIMIVVFYCLAYSNEQAYSKKMEKMLHDERTQAYEKKLLEMEKDSANASNRAKSDFLANMSHEIRTPMNAIIGMDEVILRQTDDPKIRKYAANIQSAGRTLLSIINDILDLSKIESGRLEIIPVGYNFSSVINDIVNMTMKKAQEKGLDYVLRVSPVIPSVFLGDEIRIRQIMLNLINNAIKYTNDGSVTIFVSYDTSSSKLKIIVKDTGIGIREEDIGKLFVSFTRLEESKNRNIEGTGLGLNITRRLVEMMDGEISVESEYGKGSIFTATVVQEVIDKTPIGDFAENLTKTQEIKEQYVPTFVAPGAKLLIVDDNDMNLEVITNLLSDTKIMIVTACSGRECIEHVRNTHFDVILLDQMMPGMSGTEALNIIKSEHLADDTPIIVLTADAVVNAKESYIEKGFTDYLSKPVMYKNLENILLRYLDKSFLRNPDKDENGLHNSNHESVSKLETDHGSGVNTDEEKPLVIVVSDSTEKLKEAKAELNAKYKGVFVRDKESAAKYLEKHM